MPTFLRSLVLLLGASLLFGCAEKSEEPADATAPALTTDEQKFGYAVGVSIGNSLKPVSKYVDGAQLKQGIDDALAGGELKMTEADRDTIQASVSQKIQADQIAERQQAATKAKEEGEKFLAENAQREGVQTTPSGLQYEVIEEGEGESPSEDDRVTVHYRGTLVDGTVFDSSYDRGAPATFALQNVIPGWTEGVQLMKPGAKYKFYLPSDLAYGEAGAGVKIPPNSVLIFDVELLSVGEEPAAAPAAPADE